MRLRLAAFAVAVVGLQACQSQANAGSPAGLSEADRAAVKARVDSAEAYVKAKNWDGWAAGFTEDGVLQPPNHPALKGRAAMRAWVDSFPPMTDFSFGNVTVDGAGDVAWVTSTIAMTVNPPGMAPMKDVAKQLGVFRKQSDGSWRGIAVSFN